MSYYTKFYAATASRLGVFFPLYRAATGHSILGEIHEQRFRLACDLLARTDWPVATVIAQCGYTSDSFAQKMFRKRTGMTMRKYRNGQSRH